MIPKRTWVGLAATVVVVLLAGVLGDLLTRGIPEDEPAREFALGHLIPLPIEIVLIVLFVRYAGWGRDLWREQPTVTMRPRRLWLVAIPVLAVILPLAQLGDVPWADRTVGFIALIALGTLMVGFTEEFIVRGVLLTAVRAHHGELVALLTTSVVFALAHVPGSLLHGVPLAAILIQVVFLAATGATYYWVRRVTGRIWPAMLVHAFTDWVLYLGSGAGDPSAKLTSQDDSGGSPLVVTVELLLWALGIAAIISAAREDRRKRRAEPAPVVGSPS